MFWTPQILRWDYVFSYWLTTTKPCHCLYKKGLCSCEPLSCFIHPFITYLPSELAGPTFVALHSHQIFNERINIPKREYLGDIKWFMEEEYLRKKSDICCIIHPKIRGPVRISSAASRHQMKHIFTTQSSNSEQHMYIYKGNEPNYPCTFHYSPWPFCFPCFSPILVKNGYAIGTWPQKYLIYSFCHSLGVPVQMIKWNYWHIFKRVFICGYFASYFTGYMYALEANWNLWNLITAEVNNANFRTSFMVYAININITQ